MVAVAAVALADLIDEFLRMCDLDKSGTVSLDEFLGAFSRFVAKARFSGSVRS